MSAEAPLPDVADPLTAAFWRATGEGRLVVQRCSTCGYLRWPPGPVCNQCQTPGGSWVPIRPRGVLYSYAEYHRALDPAFADRLPYTVVLVELDDGPRMYGQTDDQLQTADIGRPMRAVFTPTGGGVTFVRWRLDPEVTVSGRSTGTVRRNRRRC